MPALSDRKIEIVRTLVESAPDRVVGGLQRALAETGGESALAPVRRMVEAEAAERTFRNTVFLPVAPLFVGDGTNPQRLTFPAKALALIWRGVKEAAPEEAEGAARAAEALAFAIEHHQRQPDPSAAYNALVAAAAQLMRGGEVRDLRLAAELCDRARPGGAAALLSCLEISPVVRRAIPKLTDWVGQPSEAHAAAARLAFKDAAAIDDEAGPRFFEMLGGHLNPPWMVLRVISAVMDKPTERYLHDSELGGFAERMLAEIDDTLKALSKLDLDAGLDAAREAAHRVGLMTEQTFELEVCMDLYKDHGWGRRILDQKQALAAIVERHLKDAEKLTGLALPVGGSGLSRLRKQTPRFEAPPDLKIVARAATVLAFAQEVRPFAGHGGFSAAHAKTMEKLGEALDHYVEEAVDIGRTGHAEPYLVQAYLLAASELARFIRDPRSAELIRRRAASARPEALSSAGPGKQYIEI